MKENYFTFKWLFASKAPSILISSQLRHSNDVFIFIQYFVLDGNGEVPEDEFKAALKVIGLEDRLERKDLAKLVDMFDGAGKGYIDFDGKFERLIVNSSHVH